MIAQILLILEIIAPVFFIASVGYLWARIGAPFDIGFVTRLAMNVAGPCLLFSTLVEVEIDPRAFEALAGASLAAYAVMGALSLAALKAARMNKQAYWAPVTFGNTGNLGLPIALFAFGEQGLALALIVFAVTACLTFTVGVWMVSGKASPFDALKQPIFYGAAIGAAFAYQGWGAPEVVLAATGLMGQITIPLMLLTLGVSVARLSFGDVGRAAAVSVAKALIGAVAALIAIQIFALPPTAAGVLAIQCMMPVAVTSYLLSERYRTEPQAIAGLVVVSTLLALLTAPLTLAAVLPGPDGVAAIAAAPRIAPGPETWSALWGSLTAAIRSQ
ncbi:MAG: AEC family transporter [Pseudomonadota bacterium]